MIEKVRLNNAVSLVTDSIFVLVERFDFVGWSFVKQEGNRVAHSLARIQPYQLGVRMSMGLHRARRICVMF